MSSPKVFVLWDEVIREGGSETAIPGHILLKNLTSQYEGITILSDYILD
jgi:hypothetical protein